MFWVEDVKTFVLIHFGDSFHAHIAHKQCHDGEDYHDHFVQFLVLLNVHLLFMAILAVVELDGVGESVVV